MAAYKDEERGTWYVSFYYEDWTGVKKRKVKRGFRTKKEALNFEMEYKRTAKADMDMTMEEFVEIYFRDKSFTYSSSIFTARSPSAVPTAISSRFPI